MTGINVKAEQGFHVGRAAFLESRSPVSYHAIAFEDDGTTGYLYVLDHSNVEDPILDVLYLYDAVTAPFREQPCNAQIAWSADGLKAALLINWFPNAVVDFEQNRAWCRTGRSVPETPWGAQPHEWDEAAMALVR